jgi:hypothetical protein
LDTYQPGGATTEHLQTYFSRRDTTLYSSHNLDRGSKSIPKYSQNTSRICRDHLFTPDSHTQKSFNDNNNKKDPKPLFRPSIPPIRPQNDSPPTEPPPASLLLRCSLTTPPRTTLLSGVPACTPRLFWESRH